MIIHDARGVEIQPGQIVVYTTGGKYTSRSVAVVIETRKRVKLGFLDSCHQKFAYNPSSDADAFWADGASCFVVDSLPHVDGRLNTDSPELI